jgi:hypothetical protein
VIQLFVRWLPQDLKFYPYAIPRQCPTTVVAHLKADAFNLFIQHTD